MQVSLSDLKVALSRVKQAITSNPLDVEYIQLKADNSFLWVGGRGASISYTERIPYTGTVKFRSVYISVDAVQTLLVNSKEDTLEIDYDDQGKDLVFSCGKAYGVIKTVAGFTYADPYTKLTEVSPFCILESGEFLRRAIKLVQSVKTGWTKATIPYSAGFVRLAVYDEENFREEEESPLPQVCRFVLDDVTAEQEKSLEYRSSLALSLFTSDELRYFQMFEPVYTAPPRDFNGNLYGSLVADQDVIGKPIYFELGDIEILGKLLSDESYRVGVIEGKAVILFNENSFIWIRMALGDYNRINFNRHLSLFYGEEAAVFTPDDTFIKTVKAIVKIEDTRKHGLTLLIKDGKIRVSSPETASAVRYGEIEANTYLEALTIIDANGFLSAVNTDNPLRIVIGSDFTAVYNAKERSRVVLRNFKR